MRKFFGIAALIGLSTILFFGCQKTGQKPQKYTDEQIEGFAKQILSMPNAPTRSSFDGEDVQIEASRDVLTIGSPNAGKGDTLYDAANKIQNNFLTLFDAVYTNLPPSLTRTNLTITDGSTSVTSAKIITSVDDVPHVRSLTDTATGATNYASFTGDIIRDGATIKEGLQDLETDLDAIQTLSGVADAVTNLGTFTGTTIPDSSTIKAADQALETKIEAVAAEDFHKDGSVTATGNFDLGGFQITNVGNVDGVDVSNLSVSVSGNVSDIADIRAMTGTIDGSLNLGSFDGGTIPDNQTVKAAIQALETNFEVSKNITYYKQTGSHSAGNARDLPFHGWGQAYNSEVGMKFNAISIPRLIRPAGAAEKWQYVIAEVRVFDPATSFPTSGVSFPMPVLVATGRAAISPNETTIDDVFVQLYNPLGGSITIDESIIPAGAKFFIGYYTVNEKGPAACGDVIATTDNQAGSSYYYSYGRLLGYTGDPNCCVDQIYVSRFDAGGEIYNGALVSNVVPIPMLTGRQSCVVYNKARFGDRYDTFFEIQSGVTSEEIYRNRVDYSAQAANTGELNSDYMLLNRNGSPVGVSSAQVKIRAINVNAGAKSILCIGDSLTSAAVYLGDMNTIASATGDTLTFLGTQGSDPTKHEGRGGYTIDRYWNPGTSYYVANPFTQNDGDTFNFSYYLTNSSIATPDAVVIALGTNDIFGLYSDSEVISKANTNLGYLDQMITSIHAVSPNIRVFLTTTPTGGPWGESDGFPYVTSHKQSPERYRRTTNVWNRELYKKFGNRTSSKIYIVPIHLAIDPDSHFADGVHLTATGYQRMAESLMAGIKINW